MNIRRAGCRLAVLVASLATVLGAGRAFGFDPLSGDFTRDDPTDIRIVAYNHHGDFISDSSKDAAFARILSALDPDIISFEEFPTSISMSMVASRMNSIIPIGGSGWQVHFGLLGGTRTVLCSRYPLLLRRTDTSPASSTRGVTLALADLPDATYSTDIYLLAVHLKCCGVPGGSEDASRQDSADAMANWMADARGLVRPSGDLISLPADTPMVALGDFNLVGGPQPELTILTGDIQQTGTYGPPASPDWDNSDLTNLNPLDPFTGDNFTWQGSSSYDPSPLDRMFYTDSVVTVANSFVLNTDTMSALALANAGLQAGDTLPANSSDHLPIAMDIAFATGGCSSDPECDDGIFCNGAETCVGSVCQPGVPPTCDDGITCTTDSCNAGTDACQNIPNDNLCDNGLFCDGDETCNATTGCQPGTPIDCNDGVGCTDDSCNEATDSCDNVPNDANCDNGLFCDGVETCSPVSDCVSGIDPCGGASWCAESIDVCNAFGDGDFDGDMDVDLVDFQAFQACFGVSAEFAPLCGAGNLEGQDGLIDLSDYATFSALLEAGGP